MASSSPDSELQSESPPASSRAGARLSEPSYERLWRVFLSARVVTASVLLGAQLLLRWLAPPVGTWSLVAVATYFALALAWRLLVPAPPGPRGFARQWLATAGVDVLVFAALQALAPTPINYGALLVLPVLLAAVLGTRLLGLASAAAATLALLGPAWWLTQNIDTAEATARIVQAGLTGGGFFLVALLAHELATRLAREEQLARRSQRRAVIQAQAHELIIEQLSDGVLVVDAALRAVSANPAALQMLGRLGLPAQLPLRLSDQRAWEPLARTVERTVATAESQTVDVSLPLAGQGQRQLHVRARLAAIDPNPSGRLCVLFIQDMREMQARLRSEKLVAMGRMSMAVAHEIRNPLAAILQANALLDEDLGNADQKRLTRMVRENALRLANIAEEVLELGRHRDSPPGVPPQRLALDAHLRSVCEDWVTAVKPEAPPELHLHAPDVHTDFDPEHLRRVIVNLLDNARRHASVRVGSVQVRSRQLDTQGRAFEVDVWSDGAALDPGVEQHLFEPFFSSQSRSTGLGLFICRELCERHGASISYQRSERRIDADRRPSLGNGFVIRSKVAATSPDLTADTIVV